MKKCVKLVINKNLVHYFPIRLISLPQLQNLTVESYADNPPHFNPYPANVENMVSS